MQPRRYAFASLAQWASTSYEPQRSQHMTDSLNIPPTAVEFLTDDMLAQRLDQLTILAADYHHSIAIETIGISRGGRNLPAITLGTGPRPVGITAGAHADEPTGPMAALALVRYILTAPEAKTLLHQHTFRICPQVNPDGAAANAAWPWPTAEVTPTPLTTMSDGSGLLMDQARQVGDLTTGWIQPIFILQLAGELF